MGYMPFFCFWSVNLSQLERKLTEMLIAPVEALGFELVGVEFVRAGKHSILRVFIDHEDGIDVDNCADASHQISAVLDVEDIITAEYNLEVSSPGMDRPLFNSAHYALVVGETITVKLSIPQNGRRNFKGLLLKCENDTILVKVDNDEFSLAIANIEKGNLVPNFD
jgi:ribosome maturation factor RimP